MGNASTAMIAGRIPPCPTSHVLETWWAGRDGTAQPISDSWPPPFEKDILLGSKLATGTSHADESATALLRRIGLLPAGYPRAWSDGGVVKLVLRLGSAKQVSLLRKKIPITSITRSESSPEARKPGYREESLPLRKPCPVRACRERSYT